MTDLDDDYTRAKISNLEEETEALRLENERTRFDVRTELAGSLANRVYPFFNDVRKQTAADCILQLENWFRQDPEKPILIDFYSPGGDVFAGLALIDRIKSLRNRGAKINTKVSGYAASMGAVLLQAGEERIASTNSWLMLHELSNEMYGSLKDLEDQTVLSKRLQGKLEDIILERAKISLKELRRRVNRKDLWLDAEEALTLGLVDRVEA